MMKITINVPSYKRAGNMETWNLLPGAKFWVHEFEAKQYRKAHKGIKIGVIPDKLKGNIARVRNFIMRSQPKNIDACLIVDDDIHYFGYWQNRDIIRLTDEAVIMDMILRYSFLARELRVKLWGINVNSDKQVYREYTPFSMLSYVSASFSCFMKGNAIFYDERFSLKEDYDMTLAQCNRYRKILRINKYFYQKKGAEQIGGCSTYRNVDKEMKQINLLQKKWGVDLVRHDENTRSHSSTKVRNFDINPVIRVPIHGI